MHSDLHQHVPSGGEVGAVSGSSSSYGKIWSVVICCLYSLHFFRFLMSVPVGLLFQDYLEDCLSFVDSGLVQVHLHIALILDQSRDENQGHVHFMLQDDHVEVYSSHLHHSNAKYLRFMQQKQLQFLPIHVIMLLQTKFELLKR